MTTYLTPGVYVEEDLSPKLGTGYGDARAIAAFVGITDDGPAVPTLVTSWTQYVNAFGGFAASQSALSHAVYQYFANGGGRCYIVRATRPDSVAANGRLKDSTPGGDVPPGPLDAVTVTALAPGIAGNSLSVVVTPTGAPGGRFNLRVLSAGVEIEIFEDLGINPADPRYAIAICNSPIMGSRIVKLTNLKVANSAYVYNTTKDVLPAQTVALGSGAEGSAPYDLVAATKLLGDLPDNFDVNLPGVTSAQTLNAIITWAEQVGKVFVVVDGPRAAEGATSAQVLAGYTAMATGGASALNASSYAAIYGPWLMVPDPSSSVYGAIRMVPPGGAVLGKFARNDALRHVGKAPAGIETKLDTALTTESRFTAAELDTANDDHINIIRSVPGHGICIMGSRTLKLTLPDFYVPIRRTLMLLRKQLADITRFAIFEPNGPDLWTQLNLVVSRYLTALAKAGVLAGTTESQAYFVKCDADINPPSQVRAGRVNIDVGVALRYPAEFVIIRIGQYDGGSSTTEA